MYKKKKNRKTKKTKSRPCHSQLKPGNYALFCAGGGGG
jgi:hypothetical protein